MRGGAVCGPESDGGRDVRSLRTFGATGPDRGADGAGGGVTVLLDPVEPGEDGLAAGRRAAREPALASVAPPNAEAPAVKLRMPATAEPIPAVAIEPTATALPATNAEVLVKSPPVRAGDPPRTAANSFGICQQSIMKMIEAPIISSADIPGLALE